MSVFANTRVSATVGGKVIIMEAGRIANQADGAVWMQSGETVVMVTACSQPLERDLGFFPLTVEYTERMYAAGRIPGSFFRREIGRPSERETLVSRLIDRPVRPLFPKGFRDEVQVLASVLSADQENDPDVLAVTGASLALSLSSIPFSGPVAGARVGRVNGAFVLNPTLTDLKNSDLNFVIAASKEAVVMVEGEALFVPEKVVAEALAWAHAEMQPLIEAQTELTRLAGKAKKPLKASPDLSGVKNFLAGAVLEDFKAALAIPEKMRRKEAKKSVREKAAAALAAADSPYAGSAEAQAALGEILGELEKSIVRERIRREGLRIDGRDTRAVRPILIELSPLPRTHGSAIFARGETKSLVATTLGSSTDEQRMDSLVGGLTKKFMLHYNFPPFCVGEVKPVRVSRREIGHGALAEKALRPVLPLDESFPFTIRVVAETLESNGSSSMAAVCGGCLALMDAGVPLKAPVAGIAMGLIKEGEEFIVLTDILGDEDALGDMDFKIAGTADGVTAVQMDIKVAGISPAIMASALEQAKVARLHILSEMAKALPAPRAELSRHAPQHTLVEVNPEVIRLIIGPGGKNIKAITAETGASVDIDDSGKVAIFAPTLDALEKARELVLLYDQRAELGKNYEAKVIKLLDMGCIVELSPNLEALVHISQLALDRVERVEDVVRLGDVIPVKVIEINGDRVRASRRVVLQENQGMAWNPEDTARPSRPPRERGDRGRGDSRGQRGERERGGRERGGRDHR
ncbi:MAG: polyribonucleotide nucleotidyltransferase [Desulfovibrio sp.]|jgi:polyribonucleotide nucleotidyltransferase|nr:polyribonucleotide nucleotidyltransferase [Desulfovibrio sp.]